MEIFVVTITALLASALTLFSGFGLGTLLMPVVALFFPLEIAIAVTAIVHLANNLFKVALLGRHANPAVLVRFGIPAILFAFIGAIFLGWLSDLPALLEYTVAGRLVQSSPIRLIVGLLILVFVILELSPGFSKIEINRRYLPFGGALSGFFGGLSGHQGAFRSMFLLKAGLTKEAFIATGVVLAVMVDIARMLIYGRDLLRHQQSIDWALVTSATVAAFLGAWGGARLLNKITIRTIQIAVSILLIMLSLGLITGLI